MTKPATGIGQSQRTIGSSCQTATRNTASETPQKASTCATESAPDGSSRVAVRGLRASIDRSISRLSAMASERAPTIASVIQPSWAADGTASSASSAPTYANGSAKTVCSILTSRAKRTGSGEAAAVMAIAAILRLVVRCARAGEERKRVLERRTQHHVAVPAPARGTRQVDDEGGSAHPGGATGEQAVRRLRDRVGAQCLGDPRRDAVDDVECGFGCDVARPEPGAAGGQHERRPVGQLGYGLRNQVALVWNDAALDLVAVLRDQALELVSAAVLALARRDAVRDGQHGGPHTGSLVFSRRRTPSTTISLSIALAMS